MPNVRIADKRVWVGDESRPLLHGEVHYWRLSPERWPDVLRSVRELGLDVISSYICWAFHELAPRQYDFRGETEPRRNLLHFIELTRDSGFWLILRPGPYIYAEWRNSGVPDRVVRFHRAHPEFRQEAEHYMAAVVDAFAPFLATRGGPVVLVQADNEPDTWADHYAAQLGLADGVGPFQAFLRQRYANVAELNAAWGTELRSFDDARAVITPLASEQTTRYMDVVRFTHHFANDITRWTADTYRRLGVDVPVYANVYSGFGVENWREMEQIVDVVGPDFYPTAEFRVEPDEHWRMLQRVRYSRSYSALPYIPEFEAGIWHGWHTRVGFLPPNQYRLICLSALLAGVAGWGWYMLVNRDNWMMSPIDELGNVRPDLYAEFGEIVRVFREMDPPLLVKLGDTAVAQDVLQLAAQRPPGEPLLKALYLADIDHECFDTDTGKIAKPLVFYAGADWLPRAAQERLRAYVEGGGTVVFFQDLPTRDELMRPLNFLDLRAPVGVLPATYSRRLRVQLGDVSVTCGSDAFGWFRDVPGQPIEAERISEALATQQGLQLHATLQVGERYVVGYRASVGSGTVVQLSLAPSPEVVVAVHQWMSVPIASRAASQYVSTALFRRPDGAVFLVAVNNGEEPRETTVTLDYGGNPRFAMDLFSGASWPVDGRLVVPLARKSGTAIRLE